MRRVIDNLNNSESHFPIYHPSDSRTESNLEALLRAIQEPVTVLDAAAFQTAIEQYEEALRHHQPNEYVMRHLAQAYEAIGDHEKAAEWWRRITETRDVNPDHIRTE
jgi:Tfp pilus assembly protein PilF